MRVLLGGSSNDQGKGFDSLSRWVPQRGGYKSSALKLDREWTHRASGHLDEDVGQESMRLSIRIAGRSRGMCDTKTPPTQKYAAAPSTSAVPRCKGGYHHS